MRVEGGVAEVDEQGSEDDVEECVVAVGRGEDDER